MRPTILAAASQSADILTPPGSGTFTTILFVLIALLALATVIALAFGVRRARARKQAERQVDREAVEAGVPEALAAPGPSSEREAPLEAQSLDRSATDFAPPPPTHDDIAQPRPVAPGPGETEPLHDEAPPARPLGDERIAAAAPMDASPATAAEPGQAAAEPPRRDLPQDIPVVAPSPAAGPVTQLKGLGPKVAGRLAELGVTTVGQIAALDADQAQDLDGRLGPFAGRLHRDRWVEQARFLAAGDRAGFEAVFGKL